MQPTLASEFTLRRMPIYLDWLVTRQHRGVGYFSATQMAKELAIYHTQVRKDLAIAGLIGKPRIGHKVATAIKALERYLGWNNVLPAVLVGAGHFGQALIRHSELKRAGVNIVAAIDNDPAKLGLKIDACQVDNSTKLTNIVAQFDVQLGIICTPAAEAASVYEQLLACGVKTIWNLTATKLEELPEITVENTSIGASLAVLTRKHKIKNGGSR